MCSAWRILRADVMQVRRLSEHVSIPLSRSCGPLGLTPYWGPEEKRPARTSLVVEEEHSVRRVEAVPEALAREQVEEASFAIKGMKDGVWPLWRGAESKSPLKLSKNVGESSLCVS